MIVETAIYKFYLAEVSDITYGQKRQLQKVMLKDSSADGDDVKFGFGSLIDVQDEILKIILNKIEVKKTGQMITENCFDFVQNMKSNDPDDLYEQVTKVFNSINKTRKKKV